MTEYDQERPKSHLRRQDIDRTLAAQAFWGLEIGSCHDVPRPTQRVPNLDNPSYIVTVDRETGEMKVSSPDTE